MPKRKGAVFEFRAFPDLATDRALMVARDGEFVRSQAQQKV